MGCCHPSRPLSHSDRSPPPSLPQCKPINNRLRTIKLTPTIHHSQTHHTPSRDRCVACKQIDFISLICGQKLADAVLCGTSDGRIISISFNKLKCEAFSYTSIDQCRSACTAVHFISLEMITFFKLFVFSINFNATGMK